MKFWQKKLSIILFLIIIGLILFPVGMRLDNGTSDEEILISKAVSSKKISLFSLSLNRDVFNEINNKKVNYKLLNVRFVSTRELLSQKNTKFYKLIVLVNGDKAKVAVIYFKSGMVYTFYYVKENGNWKETHHEWGRAKLEPSKPYYIYLENMRLTDKNYKNYNKNFIPRDSLK